MLLATATVPGHSQAHHARSQNEGAARTDEPAHKTADKADHKKENHINQIEIDEFDCFISYVVHFESSLGQRVR